ncbi:Calmodulin [Durusdinium trenchii]|uniref:Calmodulin n=1 Tax=Durusdinium trenchii TaxID=1381693 RepID=A0ABP0JLE7_9DINO
MKMRPARARRRPTSAAPQKTFRATSKAFKASTHARPNTAKPKIRRSDSDALHQEDDEESTRLKQQQQQQQQQQQKCAHEDRSRCGEHRHFRNARQKLVLHSATLAFKHKIKYPAERPRYHHEMKRERMRTLDQQRLKDKTVSLRAVLQEQREPQQPETQEGEDIKDMNTLAFGWDTLSKVPAETNPTSLVWDRVGEHMSLSEMLKKLSGNQTQLPDRGSTLTALRILQLIQDTSEDEVVRSSLRVAIDVLHAAAFGRSDDKDASEKNQLSAAQVKQLCADRVTELEIDNEALEFRVMELEERVTHQDMLLNGDGEQESGEEGNNVDPSAFVWQAIARVAPTVESQWGLFATLVQQRMLKFDKNGFGLVFQGLQESAAGDLDQIKMTLDVLALETLRPREILLMLESIFARPDARQLTEQFLDRNPTHEKMVLLESRSMTRIVSFWEVHWDRICDVLWMSTDLLDVMIEKRHDVIIKVLQKYSDWLGFGNRAKVIHEQHRVVLENLLSQVVARHARFLESAMLRNRQVLREVFESEGTGEELVASLASSSPSTLGTMLDHSKPVLGKVLRERSKLLSEVVRENPALLISLAQEDIDVFAKALATARGVVPALCHQLPVLIDAVVEAHPDDLAVCIASSPAAVASVLLHTPDNVLVHDVLGVNQELLCHNVERLDKLGLRNLELYQSQCCGKTVQTDPIQQAPGNGNIVARPLAEIVGKRRKEKATVSTFELGELCDMIAQFYQEKVEADQIDDRAGHSREPFSEVIYDHFVREAQDDAAAAKKALGGFVASLKQYFEDSSMVHWFALMSGGVNPEAFNTKAVDFFLSLLCAMIPVTDVEDCMLEEEDGVTVVPAENARDAVAAVASMYWYDEQDRAKLADKIRELDVFAVAPTKLSGERSEKKMWAKVDASLSSRPQENGLLELCPGANGARDKFQDVVSSKVIGQKNRLADEVLGLIARPPGGSHSQSLTPESDAGKGSDASSAADQSRGALLRRTMKKRRTIQCVSLLEVLDVVMDEWYCFEQAEVDTLVELFIQSDTNGDGVLSFDEFLAMVLIVDPYCDSRTVRRMFKMTGEENDEGEHIISPEEFVDVMRAHKYSGPALAHLKNKADGSISEGEEDAEDDAHTARK